MYALGPRGIVAAVAETAAALRCQVGAILATGNTAAIAAKHEQALAGLPPEVARAVSFCPLPDAVAGLRAVLYDGDDAGLLAVSRRLAVRPGPIVQLQRFDPASIAGYDLDLLLQEQSVSTNTAAAGGNASLMSIG